MGRSRPEKTMLLLWPLCFAYHFSGPMPAIKIPEPYKIKFYSNENDEPPRVHVKRERKLAKFWIGPVSLESSGGFAVHELQKNRKPDKRA